MGDTEQKPTSTPLAILRNTGGPDGDDILLSASAGSPPVLEVSSLKESQSDSLQSLNIDPTNLAPHLKLPASQIHIIISTNSGLKHAQAYYDGLLNPLLNRLKVEHTTHITDGPASIAELTTKVTSNGFENLIVLLSGDTGVTEYINALSATAFEKTTVCILPLGTANAFASAHGLGLKSLLHGKPKPFPTFTATFSPGCRENGEPLSESLTKTNSIRGCVVASYGFHASIVGGSETPEYRKHGINKFKMVAEEVMKGTFMGGPGNGFEPYNATVTGIDAVKGGTKHTYLMLALVDRMEPTFVISPKSRDGQVWALYTGDIQGKELIDTLIMGAYAGGKHIEHEVVGYEQSKGFKIENMEDRAPWKRWICVDGRFFEVPQNEGWAEIKVEGTFNVLA